MKIEFYGAAGCVTGSCHILSVNGKKILLDCGMYQGKDEKERSNDIFKFNAKEIDYVILSHAHIDHSGRIPLLYKLGFEGKIICTEATLDLCSIMLPDSGHIQEMEVEWKNRKRLRQGLQTIEPLYTSQMAESAMYLFKGEPYDKLTEIFEGFKVRFRDAGHLLGAAIVEMFIKENDKEEIKLVYSGDLGNKNLPLIKDPTLIDYADYVIMETTYGDRLHGNVGSEFEQLAKIIEDTIKRGGNVVIPSFAVGRAQEVLYELDKYIENKRLKNLTVYVDSPLATQSTKVFENYRENYNSEAREKFEKGINPLNFEGLIFTNSVEESAAINKIQSGAIIISASGMCEAGRIRHHLKHNLWRKECSIVFVGYQAEGTLGRQILEGARKVKLFGEEIAVNANIYALHALSGHADRNGLFEWVEGFKKKPKEILLVHGDKEAQCEFEKLVKSKGYNARIMNLGESFLINGSEIVNEEIQDKNLNAEDKNLNVKDKILKLIDSIEDIDSISNVALLEKIEKVLNE